MSSFVEKKIKEVFKEHGIEYRLNDRSFVLDKCIDCDSQKRMYVFRDNGGTSCFKCGARYSFYYLISKIMGIPVSELKDFIYKKGNLSETLKLRLNDEEDVPKNFEMKELKAIKIPYNFFKIKKGDPGDKYLQGRGVDRELYDIYDLRYVGVLKRVGIPVYMNEICIGWQARDVTEEHELKIVNLPFPKSRCLLGYDQFLENPVRHVILVEGPFDLFKVHYLGGGLCTFGKEVSSEQIRLIKELGVERIYLAFDSGAGLTMKKLADTLQEKVWIMKPPGHRDDFGACTYEEVDKAFSEAIEFDRKNHLLLGV